MRIASIASREQVAADQRSVWDDIVASRGSVRGPFLAMLHSPQLAGRVAHLGTYIRFESTLDPHIRELATLATATTLECEYEASAHEGQLREAGVPDTTLSALKERRFQDLPEDERWIGAFVQQVLVQHRVNDDTFKEAERRLGTQGVVELTGTIGYYALLAATLNTFDVKP